MSRALVLGGHGAIGAAIADRLQQDGCEVLRSARDTGELQVDPFGPAGLAALDGAGPLDTVVWAQGANANDSVADLDLDVHEDVLRANVVYVSATLNRLLTNGTLQDGARLCVIGSVWQLLVRQSKFSYSVAKTAVTGLVRSAAVDLAPRGILVNGVLPGVVDTPMTRAMLTEEQQRAFAQATGFDRLVALQDVANAAAWLCSPDNTGVTGQLLAVDLGFSAARRV